MWRTDKGGTPDMSFPKLDPLAPGWPTIARSFSFTRTPFILINTPKRRFTTHELSLSALINRPPCVYFLDARLRAGIERLWSKEFEAHCLACWFGCNFLGQLLPCGPCVDPFPAGDSG